MITNNLKGMILSAILLLTANSVLASNVVVGTIERGVTAQTVCAAINDGDVVTLRSRGGSVEEAMAIVRCLRVKDVTISVEKAFSAATYVTLGGRKVCFNRMALVGFHAPHMARADGSVETFSLKELRGFSSVLGKNMILWGYSELHAFSVVGLTMYIPYNSLHALPIDDLIELLGDRYIGECE